jgi:Ribbon-helix-helix protein, copG family
MRSPAGVRLSAALSQRLKQAAEREGIDASEFMRRAISERIERILGEPSALHVLGEFVGILGTLERVAAPRSPVVTRSSETYADALFDDHQRQVAGLGKRRWARLSSAQRAAAIAAGSAALERREQERARQAASE